MVIRNELSAALAIGLLLAASPAPGQDFTVIGTALQKRVDGALAMMQYTVSPDLTSSSLSASSGQGDTNGLYLTQFGGGFTWSRSTPLYLEGNAAYSRYDPKFVLSGGTETRRVQAKWNTLVGTVQDTDEDQEGHPAENHGEQAADHSIEYGAHGRSP